MQTATTSATTVALTPADRLFISLLRRRIMECMANPVFTPEERLRANDSVYQCEDAVQLRVWHKNVQRVEEERVAAQQVVMTDAPATPEQQAEIMRLCSNPVITRREASGLLFRLRRLTSGQAEQVVEALVAAIWDRDAGAATHLAELVGLLSRAGISHQHLLIA